jgi:hypothetical protein
MPRRSQIKAAPQHHDRQHIERRSENLERHSARQHIADQNLPGHSMQTSSQGGKGFASAYPATQTRDADQGRIVRIS